MVKFIDTDLGLNDSDDSDDFDSTDNSNFE